LDRAHAGKGSASQHDDRNTYTECVHGDPATRSTYQSTRHFAVL
jgi:hypothetical protein